MTSRPDETIVKSAIDALYDLRFNGGNLDHAAKVIDIILIEIGPRDVNNCYLFDAATRVKVFAEILGKELGSLLTAGETVRYAE